MNRKLELRNLTHLAREASGAGALPFTVNKFHVPSCFLCQLSRSIDVLEVMQKVAVVHPENTISNLIIWSVVKLGFSFTSPLI